MKPSDYWHRQCYATYQSDKVGTRLLDFLGEDNIVWGSDFPHPDRVWPDLQHSIDDELGHLPEELRYKVICDNAVKLYGFAAQYRVTPRPKLCRISIPMQRIRAAHATAINAFVPKGAGVGCVTLVSAIILLQREVSRLLSRRRLLRRPRRQRPSAKIRHRPRIGHGGQHRQRLRRRDRMRR